MKANLKDFTEPVRDYLLERKEKAIKESTLCTHFSLTPSQVRYVIADIRYKTPIVNVGKKEYIYTTDNQELLKEYIEKLEAQLKEKAIKKNIAKRYLINGRKR